jgi:hypothetical protein
MNGRPDSSGFCVTTSCDCVTEISERDFGLTCALNRAYVVLVEVVDRSVPRRQHLAALQALDPVERLCFAAPQDEVEEVWEVLRVDLELGEGFAPFFLHEPDPLPALAFGSRRVF